MSSGATSGTSFGAPSLSPLPPSRWKKIALYGVTILSIAGSGYLLRMYQGRDVSDQVQGYQPHVLQVQPSNLQTPNGISIGGFLKVEGLDGLYVLDGKTKSLSSVRGLFYEVGRTGGLENVVIEYAPPNGSINAANVRAR